jgi:hypothetical protein
MVFAVIVGASGLVNNILQTLLQPTNSVLAPTKYQKPQGI